MSFQDVRHNPRSSVVGKNDESVVAALFQINTGVAGFRRLVDAIGTSKDTSDHRLKLKSTRQRILELVKDASAKLKSLSSSTESDDDVDAIARNYRRVVNVEDAKKLAKEFKTSLQEFQKVQQLESERESRFSPTVALPHSITISSSSSEEGQGQGQGQGQGRSRSRSTEREDDDDDDLREHEEVVLLDNEVAFNEGVIEEREQGIQEIETQIREANEIFKDLAVLVHEQAVTIDESEHNMEASGVSTTQAKVQLSKGSKTDKYAKTSWCWWVLPIAVVVLIILLLLIILL